nr:859_t:CDS:10 [Entrophospora candida]
MIVLPDNKKEDLIYTKCYCEENIYHLCKKFLLDEKNEDYKEGIYVCFISNEDKVVPLFRQSSSELENGLVLWDYHVILILKEKQKKFRLIPGETFVKVFASDRSHMIDKDGMWNSPPPNYPPISNQEFTMNLDLFISMTENLNSDKFGKHSHHPISLFELKQKFNQIDNLHNLIQELVNENILSEKKLQIKDKDDTLTLYIDKNSDYNLKRKISQESSTEEINDPKIIIQKAINTKIQSLQEQFESLKSEEVKLKENLLGDFDIEKSLKDHNHQLHNYNEIKDIGQMLFGKKGQQQKKCTRNLDST